jgi:hypothetical protein
MLASLKEIDTLPVSTRQRLMYILREMRPTLTAEDNGTMAGLRVGLRYTTILLKITHGSLILLCKLISTLCELLTCDKASR